MKKNVLSIGGSYFVGRVFHLMASHREELALHLVNRGTYPMNRPNIEEYRSDRHDVDTLRQVVPAKEYDAVIDFCAYEPGDVRSLLENLPGKVNQYILISTCSVYDSQSPCPRDEEAPTSQKSGSDEGSQYANKKLQLEEEAREVCREKGIHLTIFRPSFVYGPFNYAPRESFYFKVLLQGLKVPNPTDATGTFNFVYVKDIARILIQSIGNPKVYDGVFNLAQPEVITYESLLKTLEQCHGEAIPTYPVTVEQVYREDIPLPFPLDVAEVYEGSKISKILDYPYTSFEKGMKETYDIFMNAYRQ